MLENIVHLGMLAFLIFDVIGHWTHHRKTKKLRANSKEPLYTLAQARTIIYDELKEVSRGLENND
jgi:hypothetical protein